MADYTNVKKAIDWLKSQGIYKSQNEIGERLGIKNRSYLSQLVNSVPPNVDFVNKFIKIAPQFNESWLLTGEGEMLKPIGKSEKNVQEIGRPFSATGHDDGVSEVRFFHVSPTATFQEFCEGESEYPEMIPIVPPYGESIGRDSCVFEISGESMYPLIPDGAQVLCREIPPSRWHNLYSGVIVIAYEDSFVIKRIVKNRLAAEDYLIITSDNPDYPGEVRVQRADIRCIFEARHVLSYPIS